MARSSSLNEAGSGQSVGSLESQINTWGLPLVGRGKPSTPSSLQGQSNPKLVLQLC